jgi:beta-phosphoglucomutase-like phosphatase (HAD superfamily)
MAATLGLPEGVRACLFDLDGVLTDTASVHRRAWKEMFDAYLSARAQRTGDRFVPFDIDADYESYVDGKKREDGVRAFLESRGITLPEGASDDGADAETVNGLGNSKNELFQQRLQSDGVDVFDGSRRYLEAVSAAGLRVAVVSSSANTREVLDITGLARFVEVRVDGVTMREEGIAGHAGHFGVVIGVDRVGHAEDLRHNGADVVVTDLAELLDS